MTDQPTALVPTDQEQAVIRLVLDGLCSGHSRRAYGRRNRKEVYRDL